MKHKMYAVCYETLTGKEWEPFDGLIFHRRQTADAAKQVMHAHDGRVLPVFVEVVTPKKRRRSARTSNSEPT